MKKKIISALLLTTLVVGMVTGCGNNATQSQAGNETVKETDKEVAQETDKETKSEDVELTMLVGTDVSSAGTEAVIALAKEKLGITVVIEKRVGGPEGDNIVKTRLASGDMTDLCGFNSGSLLSALNPSEYFIDISNEPWMERLNDTFIEAVTVDGATYGIPATSSNVGGILYNKDIYAKYNLEIPKTWDEFLANCETIKAGGDTAIIGTFADAWTTQVLFLGDHYNIMQAEPTFAEQFQAGKMKYATTEAALESFQKVADTVPYYNSDYLATTFNDGCDMIANGEGAHWPIISIALSNIYETYGEEGVNKIGVFGVPGKEDTGLTAWMPMAFYGNKNSEKIDDIKRFMEFYISDEALDAYAAALLPDGPYCVKNYSIPDNAYDAVKEMQAEYFDTGKNAMAIEFQTAVKGPNLPAFCQEVLTGQSTPKEAAEAYDADALKQAIQLGLDWE